MRPITPLFSYAGVPTFNYRAPQRQRVFTHSVASTAARDSIQIGRPHFFNGDLHLGFGALQWSRIVELQKTQNETKKQPPTERLHFTCTLEDSYISSQATIVREIEPRPLLGA